MVLYNHFSCGLDLVSKLKLFTEFKTKAFFKATNSDSLGSISNRLSSINFPVLVAIDGIDAEFRDNCTKSLLKKPQFFFMLLKPVASDNTEKILLAQDEMEIMPIKYRQE